MGRRIYLWRCKMLYQVSATLLYKPHTYNTFTQTLSKFTLSKRIKAHHHSHAIRTAWLPNRNVFISTRLHVACETRLCSGSKLVKGYKCWTFTPYFFAVGGYRKVNHYTEIWCKYQTDQGSCPIRSCLQINMFSVFIIYSRCLGLNVVLKFGMMFWSAYIKFHNFISCKPLQLGANKCVKMLNACNQCC